MDCDRVFWVLTAAPFPTGTGIDSEVEHHLADCESCQRFAAALRPLESCPHEALPADQKWRLPRYRHAVSHAAAGSSVGRRESSTQARPARAAWLGRESGADGFGRPRAQVASFTVAPPSSRRVWWDLLSLAALLMAVAAGGWGLGVLAM